MNRFEWLRLGLSILTIVLPGRAYAASSAPPDIVREDWYLRESLGAIRDWEDILARWEKNTPEAERAPRLPVPRDGQTVEWPNPIPAALLPARDRGVAVRLRVVAGKIEIQRTGPDGVAVAKPDAALNPLTPGLSPASRERGDLRGTPRETTETVEPGRDVLGCKHPGGGGKDQWYHQYFRRFDRLTMLRPLPAAFGLAFDGPVDFRRGKNELAFRVRNATDRPLALNVRLELLSVRESHPCGRQSIAVGAGATQSVRLPVAPVRSLVPPHNLRQAEEAPGVGRGVRSQIGGALLAKFRQTLSRVHKERRLVARLLAAQGMRRQIGAVGLNQQPIARNIPGDIAQRLELPVRVSHRTGETDIQPHRQTLVGHGLIAAERMEHSPQRPAIDCFAKHGQQIRVCFAAVDDHRQVAGLSQVQVPVKVVALHVKRREVPVPIQARFAQGNNARMAGQLDNAIPISGRRFCAVVRLDPHGREHIIMLLRQPDRRLARIGRDGRADHGQEARIPGTRDNGSPIRVELGGVQMRVGVDQTRNEE